MEYTVTIKRGDDPEFPDEIFITYLRDGEKIALARRHNSIMSEISEWVLAGKRPMNGTFYCF